MTTRKCSDWIETYLSYVKETEPPTIFHKWAALYCISCALRRKVWFNQGRIKHSPNFFIVFVSSPGISRKSQAITYAEDLLAEVPEITRSADCITPQALLEDLERCMMEDTLPDGSVVKHNSLNVVSKEFESFLGQKKENSRMIVLLTDLYDGRSRPYNYRTKHSGSNAIHLPFLNLLAGTTPDSIASSFPVAAIGGGLSSRIIFIWSEAAEKKVAIPEETPEVKALKQRLIEDLLHIATLAGPYDFTPRARQWFLDWYETYDAMAPGRICQDRNFDGWYSRRQMFLLKMGTVFAAAQHDNPCVDVPELERAEAWLVEVEKEMGRTFVAVGRSEINPDVDLVRRIIEQHGVIAESMLRMLTYQNIDNEKYKNVRATLLDAGLATIVDKHPETGKRGPFFVYSSCGGNTKR